MNKASQETASTESKQLSLTDENISQADYERLRSGEKIEVEVEKSASDAVAATDETTDDESETSQTDGEDDESDDESETAKDQDGYKKPKRGFKKRIDKLNGKISAYERDMELLRRENESLKAPKTAPAQEETPVATIAKGEPNPDDYETSTEFYKAHARWAVAEETRAAKESERQEKLKAEAETKNTAFIGKVEEFKKAHDDFEETIADVDDVQMSPAISQAILESDNGPELMYELAKNKEEYARMCALSPFDAVRALGRFEARLQKPSEEKQITKPKTTTKAPPPPRTINSASANGKKTVYDEDLSQREYERMRSEQEKRRASF